MAQHLLFSHYVSILPFSTHSLSYHLFSLRFTYTRVNWLINCFLWVKSFFAASSVCSHWIFKSFSFPWFVYSMMTLYLSIAALSRETPLLPPPTKVEFHRFEHACSTIPHFYTSTFCKINTRVTCPYSRPFTWCACAHGRQGIEDAELAIMGYRRYRKTALMAEKEAR